MHRPLFAATATTLLLLSVTAAHTAALPTRGTFFYSSQCIDIDSRGETLKINRTAKGDTAEFGYSEGGMSIFPVANLRIVSKGAYSEISFIAVFESGDPKRGLSYRGTISPNIVRLRQVGASPRVGDVTMPRRPLKYEPPHC